MSGIHDINLRKLSMKSHEKSETSKKISNNIIVRNSVDKAVWIVIEKVS